MHVFPKVQFYSIESTLIHLNMNQRVQLIVYLLTIYVYKIFSRVELYHRISTGLGLFTCYKSVVGKAMFKKVTQIQNTFTKGIVLAPKLCLLL